MRTPNSEAGTREIDITARRRHMMRERDLLLWFHDGAGDPAFDLALEEVLLEGAGVGRATLLTSRWPSPLLVVGYAQDTDTGFDRCCCSSKSVPVLRRITGGTGVFYSNDLSLSLVLPASHPWSRGIQGLYDGFVGTVQETLSELGFSTTRTIAGGAGGKRPSPICFEGPHAEGLSMGGKRVMGSAQARRRGGVLVHSTLVLNLDAEFEGAVFGVPPDRIRAAIAAVPFDAGHLDAFVSLFAGRLALGLGMEVEKRPPPPEVVEKARRLCEERRLDPKWTLLPAAAPAREGRE